NTTIVAISGTNLTLSSAATGSGTNATLIGTVGSPNATIKAISVTTTTGSQSAEVDTTTTIAAGQTIIDLGNIPANAKLIAVNNLTLDGGDDDDTFNITKWFGAGALTGDFGADVFNVGNGSGIVRANFSMDGGNDDDTFQIASWSGSGAITGDAGNDRFNWGWGATKNIDSVINHFSIDAGTGTNTLSLDDSGVSAARNYTITQSTVSDSGLFGGIDFGTSIQAIKWIGSQGANTFNVTPSAGFSMNLDGQNPTTTPGDVLNIDLSATKGAKLAANGPSAGTITFTSPQKPITFSNFEQIPPIAQASQQQQQQQQMTALLQILENDPLLVAGTDAGKGSKPLVQIFDANNNALIMSFYAYEQTFTGGVRVSETDVNGDGVPDIITAPGVGRVGEVKVFDGASLAEALSTMPNTAQHLIPNADAYLLGSSFDLITTKGVKTATAPSGVAGLVVGQTVFGPDIPVNTTITAINANTNTVTLSQAATASSTVIGTSVSMTTTKNSKTAKVASLVGLAVGQVVVDTNVPANTIITAINATTSTITLSLAATATGTTTSVAGKFVSLSTTGGSTVVSVNSTSGLAIGQAVAGPTIPANAKIVAIDTVGNTIVLSAPATASNSNSVLIAGLVPEGATYTSGLNIATGDLDGDGAAEIVTSMQTGLGRIRVFDVVGGPGDYALTPFINTITGTPLVLVPYTTKDKDTTGAVVAVGDVNGDGIDEIVTAPGPGIAALVKVFDGPTGTFMRSFTAFEPTFKNGVSLAIGDVDNSDGLNAGEIIVGAGTSGSSRVRIFDSFGSQKSEFKAYTTEAIQEPIKVTIREVNGVDEIFTSQ
ncbi:MAG TPA: VCBS repeat-containing protein, partial [Pirellulales bacterium]